MTTRGLLCSAVMSVASSLASFGGGQLQAQTIEGVVRESASEAPIAHATVHVTFEGGAHLGTVDTDSAGVFVVRAWRAGTFRLNVSHAAFASASVLVSSELGERVTVVIRLHPSVALLEPLEVQARSRPRIPDMGLAGFEERRRWGELLGIGRFIGSEQVAQRGGTLEGLLTSVPGLRAVTHPACPGTRMLVTGRTPPSIRNMRSGSLPRCEELNAMTESELGICRIQFVVDGAQVHLSGADRVDDIVPLSLVAGVEVYATPAELPAEYSGYNSRCGVVAIWTRRHD
jgi:hypothetical protein